MRHLSDTTFEFLFCPKCGNKFNIPLNNNKSKSKTMITSSNALLDSSFVSNGGQSGANFYEGELAMDVGKFKQLKNRYLVLHGKFLYIYKNKTKPLKNG